MPLSNLNKEQYNSATADFGHNLIIASAGTGKTSTIVGRIGYLLNQGIKPEEILLLTFTNKAAQEMIARVSKYFDSKITKAIIAGTFHSVSYKLLQKYGKKIILKQPNELQTLFRSLYEKRRFTNRNEKTDPYDGGYLFDIYSYFLNSSYGASFEEWMFAKNQDHEQYFLIYEDVIAEFNKLKEDMNYVSFDDLLVKTIKLQKEQDINFVEILVDEYQDTNQLQDNLLNGFKYKSLFCVGDYDQSIYGFNGSDIGIISSFKTEYENAKIFTLDKNYRSTAPILDLANKVIINNVRIYEKSLKVVRKEIPHTPQLLAFQELYLQYEAIGKKIMASSTPHNEIAVIYRNNSSGDGVESNLRNLGIDCKRKGGWSFFDAKEIKAILDIMVLLINHNDMMAFIHLIEYGKGIGKAIAKDIFDALMRLGHGNIFNGLFNPDNTIIKPYKSRKVNNAQLGLFDDFIDMGSRAKFKDLGWDIKFLNNNVLKHPKLTLEGGIFLYDFYTLMKELKRIKNPENIIIHIQKHNFFKTIFENLILNRAKEKDGTINKTLKEQATLKSFRRIATLRNISKRNNDLSKFINAMILSGGEMSEGGGVNLLSIHASKGLEFKEVYVIDLMDGRFPNKSLIAKGSSIEEERRLFYVAVTRAKDILYLSYSNYDKIKKSDFTYSPFLVEAGLIKDK